MEHHEATVQQLIQEGYVQDDPFPGRLHAKPGFPGNLIDHNLLAQQQDEAQDPPDQGSQVSGGRSSLTDSPEQRPSNREEIEEDNQQESGQDDPLNRRECALLDQDFFPIKWDSHHIKCQAEGGQYSEDWKRGSGVLVSHFPKYGSGYS